MEKSEKQYIRLENIVFKGKRNINWDDVERYLKKYIGQTYIVNLYGDQICVNWNFINEFVGSKYTKSLRGSLVKIKANLVTILPQVIEAAYDRRWVPNKDDKHKNNASKGWYRYSINFELPVQAVDDEKIRWNKYIATIVVRWNDSGLYIHDIINIKKEASTLGESNN